MKIADVHYLYAIPALSILPGNMQTAEAMVMVLAIGLQESGLKHRVQVGGPARGFWQFERIGCAGVMEGYSTKSHAADLLDRLGYPRSADTVHQAVAFDGILAAGFARLNLYSFPGKLPALGDVDEAWRQYVKTWRPGKPHAERWPYNYRKALEFLQQ